MTSAHPALWFRLLLLPLVLYASSAMGQEIRVRQNLEYVLINQQPVETGRQIEVIDFFWYGCPACNALQSELESWIKRKPADVVVRRVPVLRHDAWAPHARIYYTLEQLGELERLHQTVYYGYHVEELHMSKPDVMEQWAARHGIDRNKWRDAYYSPEVDAKVARAKKLTSAYTVPATPTLVVDGRYLTVWNLANNDPRTMIAILDDLVRLARQKRAEK